MKWKFAFEHGLVQWNVKSAKASVDDFCRHNGQCLRLQEHLRCTKEESKNYGPFLHSEKTKVF